MEVKISRKEIEDTQLLLKLLSKWEAVQHIDTSRCEGAMTLSTKVGANNPNFDKIEIQLLLDKYKTYSDNELVHSVRREIEALAVTAVKGLAEEVCRLIRNRMPLKIGD